MTLPRFLLRLALGGRRPTVSGEHRIPGLRDNVTIRRDKFGVPTIEAENDSDAFFGLGFAQWQDRGFQLESLLRVTRGSLSELLGRRTLAVDRMARRIGFRRSADLQLAAVDADIRAALVSFTDGINAAIRFEPKPPHEFQLLKGSPTPWEPADVLALVKFQTFLLPSNWDVELARLRILRADGAEALKALDPAGVSASVSGDGHLGVLARDLAALSGYLGCGGGSNNWAIAGSRTATGKPILASDPHLAPGIPPPWYLAHLNTPNWAVAGAVLSGTPVFPIGHNGFACWGVTAGLTDNTDLVLEKPDAVVSTVREVIKLADGADEIEDVAVTQRGPVVWKSETDLIAMRAVWLEPRPLRGFFDAPRARSFEEFRRPFAAWPCLPLNALYADETGAISHQLVGDLPRRTMGNGTVPLPAEASVWDGWIPFDEMPFSLDPSAGYLATANDPPSADPRFGVDYVDPYRAEIIRDELGKRSDWTVLLSGELQRNQRSKPWDQLRETILAVQPEDADAKLGLELLEAWDGNVSANSTGAAVFELFLSEMGIRVAKAKAPNSWKVVLGEGDDEPFSANLFSERRIAHLVRLVLAKPDGWFDIPWTDVLLDCLAKVVHSLRTTRGPGPAFWEWGDLRQLRLEHPIFKDHWLGRAFNAGPVPIGGDMNTVFQAATRPAEPLAFTHNIPNLRAVFDASNWSNSRFVLAGGQSGNPCSPHYDDQFELWQAGETIPIAWTPDEVIRTAVASLRLSPERK